jgi:hypothetical protein
MKTKSLIYVNRFNKISITSCIVTHNNDKIIILKILYKKQNVNYNFQKHLFMMLVHTCILQIN